MGRQTQRDQRCKGRTQQPGEVRRQGRTGVTESAFKIRRYRTGGLSVRHAQQGETHNNERILRLRTAAQQRGRIAPGQTSPVLGSSAAGQPRGVFHLRGGS